MTLVQLVPTIPVEMEDCYSSCHYYSDSHYLLLFVECLLCRIVSTGSRLLGMGAIQRAPCIFLNQYKMFSAGLLLEVLGPHTAYVAGPLWLKVTEDSPFLYSLRLCSHWSDTKVVWLLIQLCLATSCPTSMQLQWADWLWSDSKMIATCPLANQNNSFKMKKIAAHQHN